MVGFIMLGVRITGLFGVTYCFCPMVLKWKTKKYKESQTKVHTSLQMTTRHTKYKQTFQGPRHARLTNSTAALATLRNTRRQSPHYRRRTSSRRCSCSTINTNADTVSRLCSSSALKGVCDPHTRVWAQFSAASSSMLFLSASWRAALDSIPLMRLAFISFTALAVRWCDASTSPRVATLPQWAREAAAETSSRCFRLCAARAFLSCLLLSFF